MAYNTKTIKNDAGTNKIPQIFDVTGDDYAPHTGQNLGSSRYGADVLAWGKTAGGLFAPLKIEGDGVLNTKEASAAAILNKLSDLSTQATLAAVLAKLSADPATQTTLAAILTQLAAGIGVTLGGSLASDATFHNAATVAAVGSEFTVPAGYKDLTVKVMGTATSCQVQFEALAYGASVYEPIMAVRALDFACSTLADQTGESWYVPIGGFDKVRMNLVAVAGGNVTVKGRAMP